MFRFSLAISQCHVNPCIYPNIHLHIYLYLHVSHHLTILRRTMYLHEDVNQSSCMCTFLSESLLYYWNLMEICTKGGIKLLYRGLALLQ